MANSDTAFVVRRTTEADLDAIVAIVAAAAVEGRWLATEAPVDPVARRVRMAELMRRTDTRSFVATVCDETIVGNLGMSPRGPGLLEFGMVVAAAWRGRGVGSALLHACIASARELRAHKVTLEVFPHNAAARALYRKFGFVEEGYFRRHLRRSGNEFWDVIPMSLHLHETSAGEA